VACVVGSAGFSGFGFLTKPHKPHKQHGGRQQTGRVKACAVHTRKAVRFGSSSVLSLTLHFPFSFLIFMCRMNTLLDKETLEADEAFWSQAFFQDAAEDQDYQFESG
jgi:hypothetical protein